MADNDPNYIYKIVCAACDQHIGDGTEAQSDEICLAHAHNCTATPEQHARALNNIRFKEIIQKGWT